MLASLRELFLVRLSHLFLGFVAARVDVAIVIIYWLRIALSCSLLRSFVFRHGLTLLVFLFPSWSAVLRHRRDVQIC